MSDPIELTLHKEQAGVFQVSANPPISIDVLAVVFRTSDGKQWIPTPIQALPGGGQQEILIGVSGPLTSLTYAVFMVSDKYGMASTNYGQVFPVDQMLPGTTITLAPYIQIQFGPVVSGGLGFTVLWSGPVSARLGLQMICQDQDLSYLVSDDPQIALEGYQG